MHTKTLKSKKIFFLLAAVFLSFSLHAQLSLTKAVGKNADRFKLGYGVFTYFDFPVNDAGTQSLRLELLDFAFYPAKDPDKDNAGGYLSIKAGYKIIFSESQTGFYLEPSFGYARVILLNDAQENEYGDGIAAAIEGGYNLEVGARGNTMAFGVKYETDRAGAAYTLNSVGLRVSYSFHLFGRRE